MINMLTNIATFLKISPKLLIALCSTESDLRNVINYNDGPTHSYGICQIKLETAREFMPTIHTHHLMIPEVNSLLAGSYLARQLNRYDGNICYAISAYNMGTAKLNKKGNFVNYKYVRKVLKRYGTKTSCNRSKKRNSIKSTNAGSR